jgi:hypothetical protein
MPAIRSSAGWRRTSKSNQWNSYFAFARQSKRGGLHQRKLSRSFRITRSAETLRYAIWFANSFSVMMTSRSGPVCPFEFICASRSNPETGTLPLIAAFANCRTVSAACLANNSLSSAFFTKAGSPSEKLQPARSMPRMLTEAKHY